MTRRPPGMRALAVTLALLSCLLLASACGGGRKPGVPYHCPMHPTYVSDRQGDCPICGMRLVPIEAKAAPAAASTPAPSALYTCPMDPEVTSGKPDRCPKCGMDLVPAAATPGAGAAPAGHDPHAGPEPGAPAGLATVEIAPEAVVLAGIQTAPATLERMARTVRAVGAVLPDETRVRHIHTKISGWIDKLFVNFTGQYVKKGAPVLTVYSPELLASQEEFLLARENAARFGASGLPEVRRGGEELLAAARRRLELFDVPASLIEELERTGAPQRTVTLLSTASGFVTGKETFEGQRVEPGMELFTVTDLSHVWVEADLYEYEARMVTLGAQGTLTLPYDPGVARTGRVSYIYPYLSPESRTLKVRLDFPNPDLALKPSMYVNVELSVATSEAVVVPDSAVMDTGERRIVFVETAAGRFTPRRVQVGVTSGGKAQILSGVSEGEKVVTRANFLLDSESRLRAAISASTGEGAHRHGTDTK